MKDQRGLIKFFYLIALLLLGILIWGYFQGRNGNLTGRAVALDNALTDTLAASGFVNSDIVSQFREERRSGVFIWIEFFKEVRLPKNELALPVVEKLRALSKKHSCFFASNGEAGSKITVELSFSGKLFSKLVLDPAAGAPAAAVVAGKPGKKIAIVIDDVGYNDNLAPFLNLGIPITFAILPHERFSKIIAGELSKKGMPYILHLPLEPEQYPAVDPGKAALLIKMTDKEIEDKFLSDLASVPGAKGVSNHMGSRFSSNAEKMRVLLKLVKAKDLFYFDSYTSSSTKAGRVAREIGLPFEENSIFVDLQDTPEFMQKQFDYALKKVNRYGQIAVIGHIQKKSLPQALGAVIGKFRENGVEFVYLPDIIKPVKR